MNNWEAIVVDDASTDRELRHVVAEHGDSRVRVIRHGRNRGEGAARNTGFAQARSNLLLPLDADDKLHPEFLSRTTRALEAALPRANCVFTDFQLFGSSSDRWRNTADRTLRDMLRAQWIPGPGTLMCHSVWERAGGYSEDQALLGNADWDFWIRAMAAGARPTHVPLPLYLYRRHQSSLSAQMSADDYRQREHIYLRHRALFDRHGAGGEFRAIGHLNSAMFAWATHERGRAVSLFVHGLTMRGGAWPILRSLAGTARVHAARRLRTRREGSPGD
jgi:glycosyltransferase involved in cell wall biosynthesis